MDEFFVFMESFFVVITTEGFFLVMTEGFFLVMTEGFFSVMTEGFFSVMTEGFFLAMTEGFFLVISEGGFFLVAMDGMGGFFTNRHHSPCVTSARSGSSGMEDLLHESLSTRSIRELELETPARVNNCSSCSDDDM